MSVTRTRHSKILVETKERRMVYVHAVVSVASSNTLARTGRGRFSIGWLVLLLTTIR